MNKGKIVFYSTIFVVVLLVLILGITLISGYNKLVETDENVNLKYSQVSNVLETRHNKIILIAEAVNGLQNYAIDIYDMITAAREAYAAAAASGDPADYAEADNLQSLALTELMAMVQAEDNPNISVDAIYSQYIDEVSSIESSLQYARYQYNLSVQAYSLQVRKFPQNIIAKIFGYSLTRSYWALPEGQGELPEVDFS
ncbi:MAG: LemA family protein [Bacilli bacterium]|jgi:LemA protein|nr:LemA family protein [Bacilli bacterium]